MSTTNTESMVAAAKKAIAENRQNGLQSALADQSDTINEQRNKIATLLDAATAIRDDLLLRSNTTDDDGTKVVDVGFSVWQRLNDTIDRATESQEREKPK